MAWRTPSGRTLTMMSLPQWTKPSVGALTTVDDFEGVSDSDSDSAADTCTEADSVSDIWSHATERTEADLAGELSERDDAAELDVEKLLKSLGMAPCLPGEPLLPPPQSAKPGVQPPPYQNLFWRQYLASQRQPGRLTVELLAEHNKDFDSRVIPNGTEAPPMTNGEWIGRFKAVARSVPIKHLARSIVGDDLGSDVAGFTGLGAIDTSSELYAGTPDAGDVPNGKRVISSRYAPTRVSMGKGRTGFVALDEASISTPGRSSSRFDDTVSEVEGEVSEVDSDDSSVCF